MSLKALVSFLVTILLASTSGWSNGSMPMIDPATAVASSHRKNAWPSWRVLANSTLTTGWPAFARASTAASCAGSGASFSRR